MEYLDVTTTPSIFSLKKNHITKQRVIKRESNSNEQPLDIYQFENVSLLIVGCASLAIITATVILLTMVYCFMKRNSSYKSSPIDLASLNLNTQIDLNNTNINNNNKINKKNSSILDSTQSNESLSSLSNFTLKSSNSSLSSSNNHNLCLSMPLAKPSLNEHKPQISIEPKMKAKSLIERRGSSNSLTLSLNANKTKKLQIITNPSKDCFTTTVEFLSKQSRLLTINQLIEVSKCATNSLYNEFYFLPFNHWETSVPGSGIKNRYKTIVPNEPTRVILPVINNDPLSTYINANHITGFNSDPRTYIAAQGPMSNTIDDFWRMIYYQNVSCIVMITQLVERHKNKCEIYFPDQINIPIQYHSVRVTLKQLTYCQDYQVRQLQIDSQGQTRFISHYWYTAWPDHNLPENPNTLVELIKLVDSEREDDPGKGLVLVHCSAGVGRTGCFLALSIGIKQLDMHDLVDVVKIVCNLRIDRGGMVQTLEQYEFIYQVLAYYCVYYKKYQFSTSANSVGHINLKSNSCLSLSTQSNSSTFSFKTQ